MLLLAMVFLAILLVVGAIVGYVLTKRDIYGTSVCCIIFAAVGFLILNFRLEHSEITIKSVERQKY